MSKFRLQTAQILQGDFQICELNLLLAFQVNCPGCFIYALPLAAELHQQYGDRLNMLGLSTAFEDFDLNTAEHTQRLLDKGELIGAAKLHFQHRGQISYTLPIHFPVAFDCLGQGHELFDDSDVEHVCHLSPSFLQIDPVVQGRTRIRVNQFLQTRSPVAYTFSVNQLQGTPSWILFDGDYTILAKWFGHKSEVAVMSIITAVSEPASTFQT